VHDRSFVRKSDVAGVDAPISEHPIRDYMLPVELLRPGLSTADEAAIAIRYLVEKTLQAVQDDAAILGFDRIVLKPFELHCWMVYRFAIYQKPPALVLTAPHAARASDRLPYGR
jgi:hypothetical protein